MTVGRENNQTNKQSFDFGYSPLQFFTFLFKTTTTKITTSATPTLQCEKGSPSRYLLCCLNPTSKATSKATTTSTTTATTTY